MRGGAEVGVSLPRLLLGDQLILRCSSIVDHFNLNVYDIIMHYSNLSLNMVVFLIIKKKYFINLSAFENVTIKEHPFEIEKKTNYLSVCWIMDWTES